MEEDLNKEIDGEYPNLEEIEEIIEKITKTQVKMVVQWRIRNMEEIH